MNCKHRLPVIHLSVFAAYSLGKICGFTVMPGQVYCPRFHQGIYYLKFESVSSYRFQNHLRISACIMTVNSHASYQKNFCWLFS